VGRIPPLRSIRPSPIPHIGSTWSESLCQQQQKQTSHTHTNMHWVWFQPRPSSCHSSLDLSSSSSLSRLIRLAICPWCQPRVVFCRHFFGGQNKPSTITKCSNIHRLFTHLVFT